MIRQDKIENKGITLVALVVTIIVLIILSGVSINAVMGENGIIILAKRAKENIELSQIEEQTKLNILYTQIAKEEGELEKLPYDAVAKLAEFKKKIADYIDEAANGNVDTTNEYVKPDYLSASDETFGQAIKQIVAEVTKLDEEVAATAEDIREGKEAWINGTKITGTNDNFSICGLSPIEITIYRQNIGSNSFENSANSITFSYSWKKTTDSTYKNNCCVAGSNDKTNWTRIYSAGSSDSAKSGTATVDISEYKYISFYSNTTSNNYLVPCLVKNISYN